MPLAVRFTLPPIGALLLLAGGALAQPASPTDRITMRFEGFGPAGLHVLTSRTKIETGANRYAITSELTTRGLASVVVDLNGHSEVRGRLTGSAVSPEVYREERRRNGEVRRSRVDYPPDGAVIGTSTPPPPEPVAATAQRGTVDNLTAYFMVERQLGRLGHCGGAIPVFDGRHRFDLYFANIGRKALSPEGGQQFSGSTLGCRMNRVEIAGFGPETGEGVQSGMIWYAALLPGDLMLPVRMEIVSDIGVVNAYLAELHGRGVDLKLME
ncbi:MAG TPA: DUF3108 domain-containing protein [Stellaceae bacterium]|jgi:hypothetical protein|nr:DUF3108 domain-containing protein [Stellaceae bacterium]